MLDQLKNQPVIITTLIKSVISLLLIFGIIVWTSDQVGAVLLVLDSAIAFIVWFAVSPVNKLNVDGHPNEPIPADAVEVETQ